jgi:hypothetical protein
MKHFYAINISVTLKCIAFQGMGRNSVVSNAGMPGNVASLQASLDGAVEQDMQEGDHNRSPLSRLYSRQADYQTDFQAEGDHNNAYPGDDSSRCTRSNRGSNLKTVINEMVLKFINIISNSCSDLLATNSICTNTMYFCTL